MRNAKRTLARAAVCVTALLAIPILYAHDAPAPSGSMMPGNMMGQMSQMMDRCGDMMQSGPRGNRPNDQWRKDTPTKPDKNG